MQFRQSCKILLRIQMIISSNKTISVVNVYNPLLREKKFGPAYRGFEFYIFIFTERYRAFIYFLLLMKFDL